MNLENFNINSEEENLALLLWPQVKLDSTLLSYFKKAKKMMLLNPAPNHIFDFKYVKEIPNDFITEIESYSSIIERNKKRLIFLNMNDTLKELLREKNGNIKCLFSNSESQISKIINFDNKKVNKQKFKQHFTAQFINSFIQAVINTFDVQTKTPVKALKPKLNDKKAYLECEITSQIPLESDHFNGSLFIHFTEPSFLRLYNKIMKENNRDLNPEIYDASREFLSIIYGCAKHSLNQLGYNMGLNVHIPTLLDKKQTQEIHKNINQSIIIPFQSYLGNFLLEIGIKEFS